MKRTFAFTTAVALTGMLAYSGVGFAAKGGIPGPPGGTGEETAAQNLSVPTIMVGGEVGSLLCGTPETPSPLVPAAAPPDPLTGYEVQGYYWVQKVHTWQAQCFNDVQALVSGAWGDNLDG
ncbi:hypothetical protein [Thiocapsa roseopersicina]|uniref:Uncharacterized protein n=1 Tax=Thiocapsa roseopersicina TaxID=1058 RepID=A0A1H3CXE4_THIRO|nr:hypothetical protein [Thiocapsa roseopersicina]SDX58892.1 hypothetical protein SAMN05421783_13924 [Thiocapsa roseopersicina]